jgi:hypothetical protein
MVVEKSIALSKTDITKAPTIVVEESVQEPIIVTKTRKESQIAENPVPAKKQTKETVIFLFFQITLEGEAKNTQKA